MTATLELLDPAALTLGANIRGDAKITTEFVDSIRGRGVLEPVIAHRDPDQGVVVDHGQRRTLAAVQAGLATIPVLVHDGAPGDEDRLVDQWTENEHRTQLTNTERVAAVQQLTLLGFKPNQIAKKLSAPAADVEHAAAIAWSPTALQHADQLTLDEAAAIAEFEDDPKAVEQLLGTIERGWGIDHEVERLRQDRAEKSAIAARTGELTAAGVTVIAPPTWQERSTTMALTDLRNGRKKIDPEKHAADCPGHVVWLQFGWASRQEGQPDEIAGCTGWKGHGHRTDAPEAGGKVKAGDMTDAERATAAAERRHVIDSNKAWKAATTVRARWLRQFAARPLAPAGAELLLARATLEGWTQYITSYNPSGDPFKVLQLPKDALVDQLAKAGPKRALQIALTVILACWEASKTTDAWRGSYHQERDVLVLTTISQWGYELSEIEQRIIDGTAAAAQAA